MVDNCSYCAHIFAWLFTRGPVHLEEVEYDHTLRKYFYAGIRRGQPRAITKSTRRTEQGNRQTSEPRAITRSMETVVQRIRKQPMNVLVLLNIEFDQEKIRYEGEPPIETMSRMREYIAQIVNGSLRNVDNINLLGSGLVVPTEDGKVETLPTNPVELKPEFQDDKSNDPPKWKKTLWDIFRMGFYYD